MESGSRRSSRARIPSAKQMDLEEVETDKRIRKQARVARLEAAVDTGAGLRMPLSARSTAVFRALTNSTQHPVSPHEGLSDIGPVRGQCNV